MRLAWLAAGLVAILAGFAPAQDPPPVPKPDEKPAEKPAAAPETAAKKPLLVKAARIETGSRGTIFGGAILVTDGKITAVGTDVKVPPNAEVIEAGDGVVMPALFATATRIGLGGGGGRWVDIPGLGRVLMGGGGGGGPSGPHVQVADDWEPGQAVHRRLRAAGIGVLGLQPGSSGQSGVVALAPGTPAGTVVSRSAALVVRFSADAGSKSGLKQLLTDAGKALEEAEKKEREKKAEAKAAVPGVGPGPSPPPAPPPEAPPTADDKRKAVLVALAKGELTCWIVVDSAAAVAHLDPLLDGFTGKKFRFAVQGGADLHQVGALLAKRKIPAIVPTALATVPMSTLLDNPAATLARAGVELAFLPPNDDVNGFEAWRDALAQLVRAGLPRDVALRGCTSVPATLLGVDKLVGAIEAGREANLVVCTGDPFEATTRIRRVILRGETVHDEP